MSKLTPRAFLIATIQANPKASKTKVFAICKAHFEKAPSMRDNIYNTWLENCHAAVTYERPAAKTKTKSAASTRKAIKKVRLAVRAAVVEDLFKFKIDATVNGRLKKVELGNATGAMIAKAAIIKTAEGAWLAEVTKHVGPRQHCRNQMTRERLHQIRAKFFQRKAARPSLRLVTSRAA
jgi:hypothetical protein